MNYLPFIFLAVLLGKKYNFTNLLSGLDLNSLSPVLEIMGIDKSALEFLSSDTFKNLTKGNVDIKGLIPLITPLISKLNREKDKEKCGDFSPHNGYYLTPIETFADERITSNLKTYFN